MISSHTSFAPCYYLYYIKPTSQYIAAISSRRITKIQNRALMDHETRGLFLSAGNFSAALPPLHVVYKAIDS